MGMDAKTLNDIKRAASEDKNPLAQSKSKTNDDISNKDRDDIAFKDLTQSYLKFERRNTKFMNNMNINASEYTESVQMSKQSAIKSRKQAVRDKSPNKD